MLAAHASSEPRTILVVDDHVDILEPLSEYLRRNGYRVLTAQDARAARAYVDAQPVDLALLDVMMPQEDGLSLCKSLQNGRALPVIFLTARADDVDRIVGLEIGGDDYIAKPFNPRELLARVSAVLRRSASAQGVGAEALKPEPACLRFAGFTLRRQERELIDPEGVVRPLSSAEHRLLSVFLEHPQRVLSREQLLDRMHGVAADVFDRSVDTQVSRLRRKIEQDPSDPRIIKTVWGGGYVFSTSVQAH